MTPSKADAQIVLLDEARKRLAKVASVDEAKKIRDQAEAIRHYSKQQKLGLEAQNKAAEIKIRAERRAGELLAKVERIPSRARHSISRQRDGKSKTYSDTLKAAGIAEPTARRFQEVASIPAPVFESFISSAKEIPDAELTSAATVRFARTVHERAEVDAAKAARESLQFRWETHIGRLDRLVEFFVENAQRCDREQRAHATKALKRGAATLAAAAKEIA